MPVISGCVHIWDNNPKYGRCQYPLLKGNAVVRAPAASRVSGDLQRGSAGDAERGQSAQRRLSTAPGFDMNAPHAGEFLTPQEIVTAARTNLAPGPWSYLIGGAETETTVRRDGQALDSIAFRPRVFRDVSWIDTTAAFLGQRARPRFHGLLPHGGRCDVQPARTRPDRPLRQTLARGRRSRPCQSLGGRRFHARFGRSESHRARRQNWPN